MTRIRQVFKWAVENEMIPASVFQGLMAVSGLRAGRCGAKESEPVKPVPVEYVNVIKDYVSRQVWAMIELQLLTGMRPGEVVIMRGCDLDTTGNLWSYKPARHKTQIHGHTRTVYLGPKAQEIIRPFLKPDLQGYLFSPTDAEHERRERLHQRRILDGTPLSCGNRPGTNRQRKPAKTAGDHYDPPAYYRAILRATDKADAWINGAMVIDNNERVIPRWHPHQLRHTAATDLRKQYGLEAAQVILGHKNLTVTEIYAEKNVEQAMRIMAQVG